MKDKTWAERIQSFLRTATNDSKLAVSPAEKENEHCDFLVFSSVEDAKQYDEKKIDTGIIEIWSLEKKSKLKNYGFSYWLQDPGVRYYADGTGTPPSYELIEHNEIYTTLPLLLEAIANFINESNVSLAQEEWEEYELDSIVEKINR